MADAGQQSQACRRPRTASRPGDCSSGLEAGLETGLEGLCRLWRWASSPTRPRCSGLFLGWLLVPGRGLRLASPDAGPPRWQDAGEECLELLALDRLLLDEERRQPVEDGALRGERLARTLVGVVDDLADLGIDLCSDLIGVVALLADLAAQEDHLLLAAKGERA